MLLYASQCVISSVTHCKTHCNKSNQLPTASIIIYCVFPFCILDNGSLLLGVHSCLILSFLTDVFHQWIKYNLSITAIRDISFNLQVHLCFSHKKEKKKRKPKSNQGKPPKLLLQHMRTYSKFLDKKLLKIKGGGETHNNPVCTLPCFCLLV